MKRDLKLVRRILLAVEGAPETPDDAQASLPEVSDALLQYHLRIMKSHGLIYASNNGSDEFGDSWEVEGLTWEGCELLEKIRDETTWDKALTLAKDKTGGYVFEFAKTLVTSWGRQKLKGFGFPLDDE